jgi:NAD(P)-dependent dehydrogenase (short-subunit alcohol dehydrogenase family)
MLTNGSGSFAGKVAFVTGAAGGIGRATALAFAREGASVVVADMSEQGSQETARLIEERGGRALAVTCDVTRTKDVTAALDKAIDTFGRLDCAFNNAGVEQKPGPAAELEEAVIRDKGAEKPLTGEVVLLTGGSRGIGLAIARELIQAGAAVALVARDRAALDQAVVALSVWGGTVLSIVGDVTDLRSMESAVERTVEQLGGLDILVNNAGVGWYGPVAEQPPDQWRRVIEINLLGVYNATRAALPAIRKRGRGQIVAISSVNGRLGRPNMTAYCASKAAVEGFMRALAAEVASEPIRCITIVPGSTLTNFGERTQEERLASGARFLEPADVAEAVLYMLLQPDRAWAQELVLWPR